MNRREFIKSTGTLLAASSFSSLLPMLARAAESNDQYLLMYEMAGGWDVSLSLDPWLALDRPDQSDYFIEYAQSELFSVGNAVYGPAMIDMKNVLADFSVIRGIFLAPTDSGHSAALGMLRSGNGLGKHADLALAFTTFDNEKTLGALSTGVLFAGELLTTTFSVDDLPALQAQITDSSLISGGGALAKARNSRLELAPKFKAFGDVRSQLISNSESDSATNRMASVVAAFKSGLSRSALLESSVTDSHSNHEKEHLASQKKSWADLARLIAMLKKISSVDGQTLFDRTTIVVYSEFSRTPALNSAKGKDHNPLMNSVLVSGPGFRKGVTVGGSRIVGRSISKSGMPYHVGVPCDLTTGVPVSSHKSFDQGTMITPEHVMATIADSMGLDRARFNCAQPTMPSIKAILSQR